MTKLDVALHVDTRQALRRLQRRGLLEREKFEGVFVYLSPRAGDRCRQREARRKMAAGGEATEAVLAHELNAAIVLFFSLLDERQRRCYAGLESLKVGAGGDARIARLLGVDPHTVAKGRRQLLAGDVAVERLRKPGGGRPSAKKTPRVTERCLRVSVPNAAQSHRDPRLLHNPGWERVRMSPERP